MFDYPTVAQFKAFFYRDFPYAQDPLNPNLATEITDQDIQRALDEAQLFFLQGCFETQESFTNAMLYLAAAFLVFNIQASNSGLSGSYNYNATSKSVGNVSISNSIPESLLLDPRYAWLTGSSYGVRYLGLISICMIAPIFSVPGRTHA